MIKRPTKGERGGFLESIIGVHCEERKFRVATEYCEWEEEWNCGKAKEASVDQGGTQGFIKLSKASRLGELDAMFIVSCCSFVWLDVFLECLNYA